MNPIAKFCIVGATFVWVLGYFGALNLPFGAPGTQDFQQYWTAWHLFSSGKNPYNGDLVRLVQSSLGGADTDLGTFSWNPPWTFLILSPVVCLPFPQASAVWFLVQIFFICAIVLMAPAAVGREQIPPWLSCFIAVLYLPFFDSLIWGQLGILLAFSIVLFLYLERKGRLGLAALSLFPLSVKPQLFLLVCVPGWLWFWQLSREKRREFGIALMAGGVALAGTVTVLSPMALVWWWKALWNPTAVMGFTPTTTWKTATLATWVRDLLTTLDGKVPSWPMVWIPVASFAGVIWYYMRDKRVIVWSETLPVLLCITLITAPYGWLYDQSILIVCLMVVVGDALTSQRLTHRMILLSLLAVVELGALLSSYIGFNQQHFFVWLPCSLLVLLWVDRRIVNLRTEFADRERCSQARHSEWK